MTSSLSNEDDFLLDEASVMAFLADCEMADHMIPISTTPTVKASQIDFKLTWSGSARSSSTISTSPDSSPVKKSWCQRRKEEIMRLRVEAKQLSTELESLKKTTRAQLECSSSVKMSDAAAALVWEEIADRQSNLRQVSEKENANLRENVKHRLHQAKTLRFSLKRKFRTAMESPAMKLAMSYELNASQVSPPLSNKAVFGKLMEGMDSIYANVDSVFSRVGMEEIPCPGRQNMSMDSGARGMEVEILDSYAVPFDLQQTQDVVWKLEGPNSENAKGMFYLQHCSEGNNTRMKSMSFPFALEGTHIRIVMQSVTRKYVEDDRIVLITRTLIQSVVGLASISFLETKSMVLKRGNLSRVGPTTVMLTHIEATAPGDIFPQDITVYPSLAAGVKTWEDVVTQYNYRVEDRLVRATS